MVFVKVLYIDGHLKRTECNENYIPVNILMNNIKFNCTSRELQIQKMNKFSKQEALWEIGQVVYLFMIVRKDGKIDKVFPGHSFVLFQQQTAARIFMISV